MFSTRYELHLLIQFTLVFVFKGRVWSTLKHWLVGDV